LQKNSTEITHQNCMLDEYSKPPKCRACTHQKRTRSPSCKQFVSITAAMRITEKLLKVSQSRFEIVA